MFMYNVIVCEHNVELVLCYTMKNYMHVRLGLMSWSMQVSNVTANLCKSENDYT